jgi:hypothetical protein
MTRSYPDIAVTKHLEPFNLTFVEGTKYLLRVINVAYDSTFLFTIDNHNFTVISADFVPIVPYNASSIAVGIGQRYNIVVEAKPFKSNATDFWIRTYILHGAPNNPNNCHTSSPPNTTEYMKTGIIRYDESSRADPTTDPWGGLDIETCRDEPPFAPFVEWKPKPRVNPKEPIRNIRFGPAADPTVNPGRISFVPSDEKTYVPLRIDWQNITFLNLNNPDGWNDSFVVLPEQHIQTEWVSSPSS